MRIGIISEHVAAAEVLRRSVSEHASHVVVWMAAGGAEAVHRCAAETPDLVLMALPLASINGVEVTRAIMSGSPCPILIVTESVRASASFVFEAMGQGAFDAVDMATFDLAETPAGEALLLSRIETISRLVGDRRVSRDEQGRDLLVAIGASAGGPAAVATVLKRLPKQFPRIVVVQHVDEEFVAGMVHWLSAESGHRVSLAKEGDRPEASHVLVAGASAHLTLKTSDRLGYTAEPQHYAYRPSVDVFFHSVSRLWRGDVIGVLLTGMGKDGALGLKALRDKGHHTIAQDQSSSVVYGMPKAAARLSAAVDILPLDHIAGRVMDLVACSKAAAGLSWSGRARRRPEDLL